MRSLTHATQHADGVKTRPGQLDHRVGDFQADALVEQSLLHRRRDRSDVSAGAQYQQLCAKRHNAVNTCCGDCR